MNGKSLTRRAAALLTLALLAPGSVLACACGCGIFDVGTSSMYASHAGGMVLVEYDFIDQSLNWSGTSSARAANNPDKAIRSSFYTAGGQFQFNRSFGVTVEVPYWNRYFQTTDGTTGNLRSSTHGAVGDIRLKGTYTGFSADMSTGVSLGVKLANGDTSFAYFDADTQIGSGSTDLLLGAYHLGRLSPDNRWTYFLQGQWDLPIFHRDNYRPGVEGVIAAGVYFEGWTLPSGLKFSPVGQLRAVYRRADGGVDALTADTGYARVMVSPGIEVARDKVRIYADVALPLYTNARGNQLFANELWKVNVSYHF